MQYWKKCEEGFLKYPFEEKGLKMEKKAKIVLIVLILQTFGEKNFSNFKGFKQNSVNLGVDHSLKLKLSLELNFTSF